MKQVEMSRTIISNTIPHVSGTFRVEPIQIKNGNATQHAFTITPIRTDVGHQSLNYKKHEAEKTRRQQAKKNNRIKHKRKQSLQ